MLKTVFALSSAALLLCATSAAAQAPAPMIVGGEPSNILRTGTPVALKMSEMLTTKGKNLKVGQRFQMEVAEAVLLNGQVVIPAGSPATGEVTDVRNKGMWGKSGKINARVLHVTANGRQIRLSGALDDKGTTGTAGVVAAVALLPIAGFVTTGTSAEIPVGAPVKGFIDEDVAIAFAPGAAPAPMLVKETPAPAKPQ